MASHRVAGRKLSRYRDQRVALLRGLVSELIIHERITTTLAKAKETRKVAEKLIPQGKKGNFADDAIVRLHHRRLAMAQVPNTRVVKKVFDDVSVRYAERAGGYTRVLKLGPRNGDAAEMAIIELV